MNTKDNIYKPNNEFKPNNKEYCIVKNNEKDIKKEIDKIFNGNESIYKKKVLITTKDKEYKTYIINKNKDYIKIVNDKIINIDEIIKIKRI